MKDLADAALWELGKTKIFPFCVVTNILLDASGEERNSVMN